MMRWEEFTGRHIGLNIERSTWNVEKGSAPMHEMGIAMEIINIAVASIPPDMPDACVARVNIQVGKLTAIVPGSLRFCFEIAAKDTPLAGAELVIEEIPIEARCKDCNHHWYISEPVFLCEKCQSGSLDLLSGRELDIKSIEIDEEDATS